jgi:general secretion pathway protein E
VAIGKREVDLRIASLPTSHGEQVVVRVLDRTGELRQLEQLGMDGETLAGLRRLVTAPHGIVLVTGPTGSGKTTTLYAVLRELNTGSNHILTLEDPIEYRLDGIVQTQVNYRKGMTFATGLRSVLRQDPDVIMVGEIRDLETARMAVQSALTGHLVLSTLHTNDSVSSVTRLVELGIEPYLVCDSVVAVLAQRLVRRICPSCREEVAVEAGMARAAGVDDLPDKLWRGSGCGECLETGYRDRIGIFEMLTMSDDLRNHISRGERASAIRATEIERGLTTLRMDGLLKALDGITTLEEVLRVTQRDEA